MSLAIALLITAVFFCVTLVRRDWAVALLIVLLPTYQFRFTVGIPTTLLELCVGALVAGWVIRALVSREKIMFPYAKMSVMFLCAGLLAAATSVEIRDGLGLLKAYIIEPLLVFIVCMHSLTSGQSRKIIVYSFGALIACISIVALLQLAHILPVPEPYASEIPRRVTSVFSFPTAIGKITGMLIAFVGMFALAAPKFYLRTSVRIVLLAVSAIGVAVNIFSVNRAATISLFVAAIVGLFFLHKRRLAIALVVCCVLAAILIPQVHQGIQDIFSRRDASADVHVVMWQGTLRMLSVHPIFGAGLGGFPRLYDVYRDAAHVELFPNPDQLWLTLWAEMGIMGLVVFHWIFFVWVKNSWQLSAYRQINPLAWAYGVAGISAIAAFLVHGLMDTPYFKNDLAIAFWILFAVLALSRRDVKS